MADRYTHVHDQNTGRVDIQFVSVPRSSGHGFMLSTLKRQHNSGKNVFQAVSAFLQEAILAATHITVRFNSATMPDFCGNLTMPLASLLAQASKSMSRTIESQRLNKSK